MRTDRPINRSDLVELDLDKPEPTIHEQRLASLLGFDWFERRRGTSIGTPGTGNSDGAAGQSANFLASADIRLDPVMFFRPDAFRAISAPGNVQEEKKTSKFSPIWENRPEPPTIGRLAAPQDLFVELAAILSRRQDGRSLDLQRYSWQLARLETPTRLPRRKARQLPSAIQVIVDRSVHLTPIWDDQRIFFQQLTNIMHGSDVRLYVYVESDGCLVDPLDSDREVSLDSSMGPVLALSDLGTCGENIEFWRMLGEDICGQGGIAAALIPCRANQVSDDVSRHWRCAEWDFSRALHALKPDRTQKYVEQLQVLLSPAIRIEPGLVREMRQTLLPEANLEVELMFWSDSALTSRHSVAAAFDSEARARLRTEFLAMARSQSEQKREVARAALSIIRGWRSPCPDEIWFEEIIDLPEDTHWLLDAEDVEHANAFWAEVRRKTDQVKPNESATDALAWRRRAGWRSSNDGLLSHPDASYVVLDAFRDIPEQAPTTAPGKGPLLSAPVGSVVVWQCGSDISLSLSDVGPGSPLARLPSDDGVVECCLIDVPEWADHIGKDNYGDWADVLIHDVLLRLRRIPAGSFLIGSAETDEDRFKNEGPQVDITFKQDFWCFDTAVTNALWQVVMDEPKITMIDPDHPKVNVSWDDANTFIQRLNTIKPGLFLRLPSEAEWEYACRAETDTPYFFGSTPTSDDIHFNSKNGTIPVRAKVPNAWGLYQMHGNVWEWCEDVYSDSHEGIDIRGRPRMGSSEEKREGRVVRGGSWGSDARGVRAACRDRSEPDYRDGNLGFRCVLGQAGEVDRDDRLAAGREAEPRPLTSQSSYVRVSHKNGGSLSLPNSSFLLRTDRAELEFARFRKADIGWAKAIGRDEYGLWALLPVENLDVLFRWIPPGQFMIGSPLEEEGYVSTVTAIDSYKGAEEPLTQISLSQGYWLMDTPVTQSLWELVMGDNPSRFQSPDRPVEQVSWEDVQEFLFKVNSRVSSQSLRLPSESEWEYACRGGTEEATYAGAMTIKGERNAPVLDAIAWYGGNSGIDFELEEGVESGKWREKQYEHSKAGTHPVGKKSPNRWGCYDMLGNVWEWCDDVWSESHEGIDISGAPRPGSSEGMRETRVVRGGSWVSDARSVRAACRSRVEPDFRGDRLGFRCVLGQSSAVARDERLLPASERGGAARQHQHR